MYANDQYLMID